MNIDEKGTAPGLTPAAKVKPETVAIRCRSNKCDSIEAVEIKVGSPEHTGQRLYQCVKCGKPISLNVGGHFSL